MGKMRAHVWLVGAVLCLCADPATASEPQVSPSEPTADFLFGRPRGHVALWGGWQMARADSDIHDFFNRTLTVDGGDFDSFVFGVDVGISLSRRVDVVFGLEVNRASASSEYRDYVDDGNLPITQDTTLTVVPLTGGVKLYLTPRGREVSRYAFLPSKVRVYAGGSGGGVWYRLEQRGDFVDFVDLSIFTSTFRSSGWGLEAQGYGGVEVSLGLRWSVAFEGRYVWATAGLGDDYVRFEPIDLSGMRIKAGVHVSF